MPTIEIYPECVMPHWMRPGAWCYCIGEGSDRFTVDRVFKTSATLLTASGLAHGMESFTKLYRSMEELEERRPDLRAKFVRHRKLEKKRASKLQPARKVSNARNFGK